MIFLDRWMDMWNYDTQLYYLVYVYDYNMSVLYQFFHFHTCVHGNS